MEFRTHPFFLRTFVLPCLSRIVLVFKTRHIQLPLSERKFPLSAQKGSHFSKLKKSCYTPQGTSVSRLQVIPHLIQFNRYFLLSRVITSSSRIHIGRLSACFSTSFFSFQIIMTTTANSKQTRKLLPAVRSPALGSMELGVVGFNDSSIKQDVLM